MSMQSLNQLVARSIIDPGILEAFSAGCIGSILEDMDFSSDVRQTLATIDAGSWAEYAILAYRVVKATEVPAVRIELPSPLTGLLPDQSLAEEERAA